MLLHSRACLKIDASTSTCTHLTAFRTEVAAFSSTEDFLKHFSPIRTRLQLCCFSFSSSLHIHDPFVLELTESKSATWFCFDRKQLSADACFWCFTSDIYIRFGNKLFLLPTECILLNDLWWAINYSGNAAEEQRKWKIETVSVNTKRAGRRGFGFRTSSGFRATAAERRTQKISSSLSKIKFVGSTLDSPSEASDHQASLAPTQGQFDLQAAANATLLTSITYLSL